MTKLDVQKRILQNGSLIDLDLFSWDESTNIISTKEDNLVFDFVDINDINIIAGSNCIVKTGNYSAVTTRENSTVTTGSYSNVKTESYSTVKTGYNSTVTAGENSTVKTGSYSTVTTGSKNTVTTGYNSTITTGDNSTVTTESYSTITTGDNSKVITGNNCCIVRRYIFEVFKLDKEKNDIITCPYKIPGYLKKINGKYYLNGNVEKGEHIIADGILSKVVSKKGNIYKVINYNEAEITYLIKDNEYWSHGKTFKEAKESLIYKRSTKDLSRFEAWKLNDIKTKKELIEAYRSITGACESGVKYFCEQNNLPDKCTIKESFAYIEGQYNSDKFIEFFKEEK